jgi:CDP-glycerol glycerophosphotransferase (TagB/SpsB family)
MTYTRGADIYIGDVSSQIYEFLRTPKPALFIRPPEDAGSETLDHFRAGEVVDSGADIGDALSRAIDKQPARIGLQRQLFNRTFDLGERPSSLRAALAIRDLLARQNGQ